MKLTIVLLLFFTFQVSANGYAQKITIVKNNVHLADVFKSIEKQTGFLFFYDKALIQKTEPIDVSVKDATLEQTLHACLKGQQLTYSIVRNTVVIQAKRILHTPVQNISIIDIPIANIVQGKVTNSKREPLVGVSVTVKGTTTGTSTDAKGNYSIDVPDNGTLIFSYVGFATREMPINGRSSLNVVLEESVSALDQIVVIGYGSQKRKDLTGSVASVQAKDIKDLGVTRIDQALVGKVAGVQVLPITGEPGSAPLIRIRGIGSISAGAGPLYVVDGFPIDDIQTLNPSDIESIDILKDASATAIYGSRGANGVIIINTRRGKSGKTRLGLDAYYGLQEVSKVPKFLSASEEAMYYYLGVRNRNTDAGVDVSGPPSTWKFKPPQLIVDYVEGRNTTNVDALGAVLRTAPQQNYQLSALGGSETVKYAISGGYFNQDGIVLNSNFKRYSVRSNLDAKLSEKLLVKLDFSAAISDNHTVTTSGAGNGANNGLIGQAVGAPYYYPLYNPDGSYFVYNNIDASVALYNPVALAKEIQARQQGARVLGNLTAEYAITPNLKLDFLLGATSYNIRAMSFRPKLPVFFNGPALGTDNTNSLFNWLTQSTLNYTKLINKHSISGLVGFTSQKERFHSNSISSDRFPNNLVPTLSAVSGIITDGSSDISEWTLVSYLARFNYNFNSKYYVTTSIRTDGSSRFGENNKYGVFPSVALAWRISEERFLKGISFINELKLRSSYGETGNNNIGNYEQYATINYDKYPLGGQAVGGYSPSRIANPALTWEKQRSVNMGLDAMLFDQRLTLTVDYFDSRNTNLLLNVNVPAITGFSTALQNIGEVSNKGWEFVLGTVNVKGKFGWTTDLNLSTYRNKVIRLGPEGDPINSGTNITMIGQPIGMLYGLINNGIYKTEADIDKGPIYNPGSPDHSRVGDVRFKDISGPNGVPDGVINSFDYTIIGSPYPKFYYGMTNRFTYNNISLNISLQGSQGSDVWGSNLGLYGRSRNKTQATQRNYWKSEQDPGDGNTPRPNDGASGGIRLRGTRYLESGSYLRINNITLAYVLNEKIVHRMSLQTFRIYLSAMNPFIFTNNNSFNPEVSNSTNALTPNRDNNNYPLAKSILLGVNITF